MSGSSRENPTAGGVRDPNRSYEFADRSWDGYRGRWRYRVIERDNSTLTAHLTFSLDFKCRADAASFCACCDLRGAQYAAKLMDACGLRYGQDFKVNALRIADTSERSVPARDEAQ